MKLSSRIKYFWYGTIGFPYIYFFRHPVLVTIAIWHQVITDRAVWEKEAYWANEKLFWMVMTRQDEERADQHTHQ